MTTTPDHADENTWPRVLVCRGCCCGSERKHPDVDHDEQVTEISSIARTRIVECVDECLYSNVVVVRPRPGESVWFGRLNSAALTADLCDWLDAGAPQPLPPILEVFSFEPRNRAATE